MSVAVITGSSSGIGRAAALHFARAGYDLVLHAHRNTSGLQGTAVQAKQTAPSSINTRCVTADISCPRACRDFVNAVFEWQSDECLGNIHVWINNAGADVLTTEAQHWSFEGKLNHLIDVDLQGTIRLSRLASARLMPPESLGDSSSPGPSGDGPTGSPTHTKSPPCIINVGWDQADAGMEGEAGQFFAPVKAAISAFSRSLAKSVGPHIRVNCVLPGWIQTDWGKHSAGPYWDQRAKSESLMQRWGTPDDVAQTMLWLASPDAGFVNGQCIAVNGGRNDAMSPKLP